MNNKGSFDTENNMNTPKKPKRVDINILKSKLKQSESKEFKKNFFIFTTLILALVIMGIYFSL